MPVEIRRARSLRGSRISQQRFNCIPTEGQFYGIEPDPKSRWTTCLPPDQRSREWVGRVTAVNHFSLSAEVTWYASYAHLPNSVKAEVYTDVIPGDLFLTKQSNWVDFASFRREVMVLGQWEWHSIDYESLAWEPDDNIYRCFYRLTHKGHARRLPFLENLFKRPMGCPMLMLELEGAFIARHITNLLKDSHRIKVHWGEHMQPHAYVAFFHNVPHRVCTRVLLAGALRGDVETSEGGKQKGATAEQTGPAAIKALGVYMPGWEYNYNDFGRSEVHPYEFSFRYNFRSQRISFTSAVRHGKLEIGPDGVERYVWVTSDRRLDNAEPRTLRVVDVTAAQETDLGEVEVFNWHNFQQLRGILNDDHTQEFPPDWGFRCVEGIAMPGSHLEARHVWGEGAASSMLGGLRNNRVEIVRAATADMCHPASINPPAA